MEYPVLSLLIWLPILAATVILTIVKDKQKKLVPWFSLFVALIVFAISVFMAINFDNSSTELQFQENYIWIKLLNIRYSLGVDGISMPLIVLTSFTHILVVLAAWNLIKNNYRQYYATFFLIEAAIIGVFAATDAILYYIFWEAMLIPMYLCIGIWGSDNRSYAAIKFFLYTFLGSTLLLIALLYLSSLANSFDIFSFYPLKLSLKEQILIFIGFILAFAVKVPMWPVHTWLPDAHTEAPAGGSVILAALMLKVGAYGFFRFCLPITPDASMYFAPLMIVLSLIAIIYVGLVALAQKDMKRLIAYSSVAHMGFVSLGVFVIYKIIAHTSSIADGAMALEGALFQMIAHAFGSGAMFLAFGIVYDKLHTRRIKDFGGLASLMPYFAAFFLVFVFANIGVPGTAGFVGEFMIIMATFKDNMWLSFAAASTIIVS